MTASRFSVGQAATALAPALVFSMITWGCAAPHHDDDAASLAAVSGEFLADGSCRVMVNGAALFAATDRPRATYDAGPVADLAPTGYALHQLTCAPADADAHADAHADTHADMARGADERMLIVTLYAPEGAPLRVGRYTIREALATTDDTANVAARAGVAVFGAPAGARGASGEREAHRAGVRYLEGRAGTLTISGVGRAADGEHVIGSFTARASPAWSM